jgi:iron complex outermembrane receptor protein
MYFNLPQPTPFPGAVGLFAGNADFRSEKVIAYEAGYRNLLRRRVAVDVASFFNRYSSLESFGVGQPFLQTGPVRRMVLPIRVENNNRGYTYGVDVASTWSLNSRWRVYANYSWLRVHVSSAAQERPSFEQGAPGPSPPAILFYEIAGSGRNPQHMAQVRSSIDVTPAWSVDAGVHRVSELAGVRIPGYTRADLHLNWRLRGGLQLSAGFNDVFNPSHREMLSEERISGSEMRRGPYVKLTWTYAAANGEERPAKTTGLTRAGGR